MIEATPPQEDQTDREKPTANDGHFFHQGPNSSFPDRESKTDSDAEVSVPPVFRQPLSTLLLVSEFGGCANIDRSDNVDAGGTHSCLSKIDSPTLPLPGRQMAP